MIKSMNGSRFYFVAGAIITLCLFLSLAARIFPSGFWAVLAFFCFTAFCLALLVFRPASFILLSPLLFLRVTEFISGIAIEYGFYIDELTTHGEPTGAFARLCALYVLLFCISSNVIEPAWEKVRTLILNLPDRIAGGWGFTILVCVTVFLLCYILSIGFQNGFPLIEGIDRFRYRLDLQNEIFGSFFGNRFILIVLFGMFALAATRRNLSILLIVAIFGVSVLYSEKFTSLSLMLILAAMPHGLYIIARDGRLPISTIVKIPLAITAITMPLVLVVYGINDDPNAALDRLINRTTNQGELWWVADRDHMEMFRLQAEPIEADIRTWLVPSAQNPIEVGSKFGLYYVMQRYAPSEIAYVAALQGTGYVFSLFAYLMMTLGIFGVVFLGGIIHLLFGLVMAWVAQSIARASLLQLMVAMKLFIFFVSGGFVIGYLWSFFGAKTILLAGIYIALDFLLYRMKVSLKWSRTPHAS